MNITVSPSATVGNTADAGPSLHTCTTLQRSKARRGYFSTPTPVSDPQTWLQQNLVPDTFDVWDENLSSIPAPTQRALRTLEWVTRHENLESTRV